MSDRRVSLDAIVYTWAHRKQDTKETRNAFCGPCYFAKSPSELVELMGIEPMTS